MRRIVDRALARVLGYNKIVALVEWKIDRHHIGFSMASALFVCLGESPRAGAKIV